MNLFVLMCYQNRVLAISRVPTSPECQTKKSSQSCYNWQTYIKRPIKMCTELVPTKQ